MSASDRVLKRARLCHNRRQAAQDHQAPGHHHPDGQRIDKRLLGLQRGVDDDHVGAPPGQHPSTEVVMRQPCAVVSNSGTACRKPSAKWPMSGATTFFTAGSTRSLLVVICAVPLRKPLDPAPCLRPPESARRRAWYGYAATFYGRALPPRRHGTCAGSRPDRQTAQGMPCRAPPLYPP